MSVLREGAAEGWRKFAALMLALAALGLPVHHVAGYALLVLAALVIFTGPVSARPRAWMLAVVIVVAALAAQWLIAPPRIEEGHNVFRPGGPGVLQRELPDDVYRRFAAEFAAQYPKASDAQAGFPDRAFAFSADGIFHKSELSRTAARLNFSDPIWLRLGFVNEFRYNWTSDDALKRVLRNRHAAAGFHRWHLAMPWFEAVKFPAAYAGGELCWRGLVMWEGEGGHFAPLSDSGCRAVTAADAGRRVFGSGIKPDTLSMQLKPPPGVQIRTWATNALVLAMIGAILLVLTDLGGNVRRRFALPILIIALSIAVISIDDLSFLGGVRPFDGGDDGLFYDGVSRIILQRFLSGDFAGALQGGENVFYYGGPGLRYFRAIEHVIFGETYLGYATLVLMLPFAAYFLFRRFAGEQWALAAIIVFVAIPIGALFGTTYFQYVKWAARGFADPAAYIFFILGLVPIIGAINGRTTTFSSGLFGALFIALGICMKPIIAPCAAVILCGAGLYALYSRQWLRLIGLCIGFVPVLLMPLHNWIYGHVFVLFSANADNSIVFVMPPSAYVAAVRDLFSLDMSGVVRIVRQLIGWLGGAAESGYTAPINALGVVVLGYVVFVGRTFDPWLRLIGAAALAQHAVALFYVATARYHFLSWFLTMLVVVIWLKEAVLPWLEAEHPALYERLASGPLASGLTRLQKALS